MNKKTGRHVNMYERIGNKYNYLTVIDIIKKDNISHFKCLCDCGEIKIITAGNVMSGSIKSCGCKKKELCVSAIQKHYDKFLDPVEKRLFSAYKKHGKYFNLTIEQFINLVNQKCHYCGSEPKLLRGNKTKSKTKLLNGIDRIDSSIGYEVDNCVPCCINCNRAKNDMSIEDFIEWIKKISKYKFWSNN